MVTKVTKPRAKRAARAKREAKPAFKKPDFEKARPIVERWLDENVEWLKEMAKR
jgi:hypothetical protein